MLSQKAILVRFSVSQWTARKFDKKATQEVEANHGANKHAGEVGRFNKQLASKKYTEDMTANISSAREFHYKQTLPWQDAEGIRILPVDIFSAYQQSMSEFRTKHEELVDTFVKQYPDVVDEARYRLNGLFDIEDFPPVDQIRSKFSWEVSFSPVPESGDFRVSLGKEVLEQMEADLSKRLSHNYHEACVDLFERIHEQTANMAERLENYTGTRKGRFNDSLVGNIRELAQLLPKLNVSGDKRLADLAARIDKELCEYDAQVLREVDGARKDVAQSAKSIAQEADDIIAQMRGMFA